MVNDRESQLYRDVADIIEQVPKLQQSVDFLKEQNKQLSDSLDAKNTWLESVDTEISSLKTRLGKLTSRVGKLEKLDLPTYIPNQNAIVESVKKQLLLTQRLITSTDMDVVLSYMKNKLRIGSPSIPVDEVSDKVSHQFSRLKGELKNSAKPVDIMVEFRAECRKISEKYKLGVFIEK